MTIVLVLTTLFLLYNGVEAMEVWLYSHGSNAKLTIDTVQRCYTVQDLWNDRAVRTTWKKLPKGSTLVFYQHAHCRSPNVKMSESSSGSFSFEKQDKLNLMVSSFMVQQGSEDPTNGEVEIEVDDPVPIMEDAKVNGSSSF